MNKFWKVKSLYKFILGATGTKVSFPNQAGILPIENSMIFVIHTACCYFAIGPIYDTEQYVNL